jgi:hypothetical protein
VSGKSKIDGLDKASKERAVLALLRQAKKIAVKYYKLTRKSLGVTGEIAEYEAANKLKLKLTDARNPGFDAFGLNNKRFQIKGRAVSSADRYRGRVPSIKRTSKFDSVLLVLLDKSTLDALEIWKMDRRRVFNILERDGSKARNERGQMGIRQFKAKSKLVWPSSRKKKQKK